MFFLSFFQNLIFLNYTRFSTVYDDPELVDDIADDDDIVSLSNSANNSVTNTPRVSFLLEICNSFSFFFEKNNKTIFIFLR